MNWKLIFGLSLFGLVMAVATVYVIPSNIEPICWLLIFIVCAWLIAKNAPGKFFLHGLLVSLVNCIWITGAHILLVKTYLANHPQELAQLGKMNVQTHLGVRKAMAIMGPVIGVISGLVLGLFSFIASKIANRPDFGVPGN
jgi:hypothetical protein